jgi:hypothetical protein
MTGELVCDILRQVCRNGVVQDQRYFASCAENFLRR